MQQDWQRDLRDFKLQRRQRLWERLFTGVLALTLIIILLRGRSSGKLFERAKLRVRVSKPVRCGTVVGRRHGRQLTRVLPPADDFIHTFALFPGKLQAWAWLCHLVRVRRPQYVPKPHSRSLAVDPAVDSKSTCRAVQIGSSWTEIGSHGYSVSFVDSAVKDPRR